MNSQHLGVKPLFRTLTLACLMLFSPFFAHASEFYVDSAELTTFKSEESIVVTELALKTLDSAVLKGLHFKNPGKPTLVLFHGLAANVYYWTQLAEELHKSGFDVMFFNMRGHGGGEFKSTAPSSRQYGFEYIVSGDVPAIIEYASDYSIKNLKNPQAKVGVIGHSMGTMVVRLALSGFHLWNHKMHQIPEVSEKLIGKVSKMMSLGSPASFSGDMKLPSQKTSEVTSQILSQILKLASFKKRPSDFFSNGESTADILISQLAEKLVRNPKVAEKVIGGVNVDNFNGDRGELGQFLRKGGSYVEKALMTNLLHFTYSGFNSPTNPGIKYEGHPIPKSLATTIVVAELDAMAIPEHILRDQSAQPIKDHITVVQMDGFGHLEMGVGEKAMETVLPLIQDTFSEKPSLLNAGLIKNIRKINFASCEMVFKF